MAWIFKVFAVLGWAAGYSYLNHDGEPVIRIRSTLNFIGVANVGMDFGVFGDLGWGGGHA